jgi:hypothetical protein
VSSNLTASATKLKKPMKIMGFFSTILFNYQIDYQIEQKAKFATWVGASAKTAQR